MRIYTKNTLFRLDLIKFLKTNFKKIKIYQPYKVQIYSNLLVYVFNLIIVSKKLGSYNYHGILKEVLRQFRKLSLVES